MTASSKWVSIEYRGRAVEVQQLVRAREVMVVYMAQTEICSRREPKSFIKVTEARPSRPLRRYESHTEHSD